MLYFRLLHFRPLLLLVVLLLVQFSLKLIQIQEVAGGPKGLSVGGPKGLSVGDDGGIEGLVDRAVRDAHAK